MQTWKFVQYLLTHMKMKPWMFRILTLRVLELFTREVCKAYVSLLTYSTVSYVQGSTYLLEVLSWKFILSQSYVGQMRMKTYNPTIKFSQPIKHIPQLLKTILLSKTIVSQAQPAFICSNSSIMTIQKCAKFKIIKVQS